MDVEMERVINPYPPAQMPVLVNSEDEIAAYQMSAVANDITNPKVPEIMNQPTARGYRYIKPNRRY